MQNAGLDEAQACRARWSTSWSQDCRENINNLRYGDDTTLMAESEEELKEPLDEGGREEWKR